MDFHGVSETLKESVQIELPPTAKMLVVLTVSEST
jgi:hypothetical protein